MKLIIREPMFYAYLDEKTFFHWLDQLDAVKKYKGSSKGLELSLKKNLSQGDLLDLIAWMSRYRLNRKPLRALCTAENKLWFKRSGSYWYRSIFSD